MIAIVNYGLGNIEAFVNIYRRLSIPVKIATTAEELVSATKIILPGVGAFDWAMTCLNESGMRACLDDLVLEKKYPVLGVCVGMQIMATKSDEGELPGLGWIDASVKKIGSLSASRNISLPHMGWNDVMPKKLNCLFKDVSEECRFYFLHSYYFLSERSSDVLAVTDYCGSFTSAVKAENVFGTQFHPEKSHQWGIQLLKNFAEL